jgi:hypothetical protein
MQIEFNVDEKETIIHFLLYVAKFAKEAGDKKGYRDMEKLIHQFTINKEKVDVKPRYRWFLQDILEQAVVDLGKAEYDKLEEEKREQAKERVELFKKSAESAMKKLEGPDDDTPA